MCGACMSHVCWSSKYNDDIVFEPKGTHTPPLNSPANASYIASHSPFSPDGKCVCPVRVHALKLKRHGTGRVARTRDMCMAPSHTGVKEKVSSPDICL